MTLPVIILLFVACAAVIVVTGARLTYYADVIAERSGLGQAWIGVIALASVTSLPELVTGASAVVLVDAPDIAAGDIVGSCLVNLLILALLDALARQPLFPRLRPVHTLSAVLGIVLLTGVAVGVLTADRLPAVGWVGVSSIVLFGGYVVCVRAIFRFERRHDQIGGEAVLAERYAHMPLRTAVTRYALTAAGLVAAAAALPSLAVRLAAATGLSEGFVGTAFVAVSTSLPEVVVSLAALRHGAWDLAAANVLGSNLFNVAILAIDDLLYTPGPLLAAVDPGHAVTAIGAAAMSAVALVGLVGRPPRPFPRVSWETLLLVLVYALVAWLAFG